MTRLRRFSRVKCLIALTTLSACQTPEVAEPRATLFFSLDAPLCSSALLAQFLVDGREVGVDTFRIHLAPDHTVSRGFIATLGPHLIGARVAFGEVSRVWPDAPDTIVTFRAGDKYTRRLPFYCS